MRNSNLYRLSGFIFIFILILIPSYLTPIHSDDFSYSFINDWSEKYTHYMSWSGRVVADLISSILLSMSFEIRVFINSFATLALLFLISRIKEIVVGEKSGLFEILFLFFLFWVSIPTLGQVVFWVVGAANYLWTSLFVFLLIYLLLKYKSERFESKIWFLFFFLISVLAGCSNESLAVVSFLVLIFLFFYEKCNFKLWVISFLGYTIGLMVLLLSPGNFKRAARHSSWYDMGMVDKLYVHFFERVPEVFSYFWFLIPVFLFSLFLRSIFNEKNKRINIYSLVFFMAGIFCAVVMLASPGFPPRAATGAFLFILLATVIAMPKLNIKSLMGCGQILLLSIMLVFFIISYFLVFNNMRNIKIQSGIREEIIMNSPDSIVEIPQYYNIDLISDRDSIDFYHNDAIATYYGKEKIGIYNVGFNYAITRGGDYIDVASLKSENFAINKIYIYKEGLGYNSNYYVLLEFDEIPASLLDKNKRVFFHAHKEGGGFVNADMVDEFFEFNNKFYLIRDSKKDLISNLKYIKLGVYDLLKEVNDLEFTIER